MSFGVRAGLARPRLMLTIAVLIAVIGLVIGVLGLDRLAPADDTFPGSDAVAARAAVEQATGRAEEPAVVAVVTARKGEDASAVRARAQQAASTLREIDGVADVASPGSPLPPGQPSLETPDGKTALLLATLAAGESDPRARARVAKDVDAALGDDDGIHLGGAALVEQEIQQVVTEDLHRAELITAPILVLLALIIFRGVIAALVPVAIAGVATLATMGALVALTYVTDVSVFALNITTALATGLGIDYGLLVVSRYREELAKSGDVSEAVSTTMNTAGRAVGFSALTVSASVASLLIFPQPYLRSLGAAGCLVALLSGLSALVLAPALLTVIGTRINALAPSWLRKRADSNAEVHTDGNWYRFCMFVTRHPGVIAVVATAALLFMAAPLTGVKFTTADSSVLPAESATRITQELIDENFPAFSGFAATVVFEGKDALAQATKLRPTVQKAAGTASVSPPQPLGEKTAVLKVSGPQQALDSVAVDAVERIRHATEGKALVGGRTARFVEQRDSVFAHTPWAALIVLLTTSFFIMLLTRSVVLPLKTAIMNALTLAATFGMLVWVFQEGHLERVLGFESQGALEVAQPAIVCALVFGLSTDYGVFLLARVREAVDHGMDTRHALAFGVERTGRIITSAAVLFCVALSATAMSRLVTVKQVGLGVAFAVLLDATIVRGLLVPALMQLLGRRNWWAPKPLARLLERRAPTSH